MKSIIVDFNVAKFIILLSHSLSPHLVHTFTHTLKGHFFPYKTHSTEANKKQAFFWAIKKQQDQTQGYQILWIKCCVFLCLKSYYAIETGPYRTICMQFFLPVVIYLFIVFTVVLNFHSLQCAILARDYNSS